MKTIMLVSKKYGDRVVMIDDDDFDLVSKYYWSLHYYSEKHIYARANVDGKLITMHRFLLNPTSRTEYVDHRDGNGLNNQRYNIRKCTPTQNSTNYRKPKTNTSGYKGVSFYKPSGRWVACVKVNKKNKHIGYFDNLIDAVMAYNQKAIEVYGEFANINQL